MCIFYYYTVSQKKRHQIVTIISSNLTDFQNFFTAEEVVKFLTKQYITLPTTPKMCCRTTSRNLNVHICCIFLHII